LFISSELSEILGLSDRILVMRQGRIVAELDASKATEEAIMRAAVVEETS
jgi:rhamnose transport system ATP-binding protein